MQRYLIKYDKKEDHFDFLDKLKSKGISSIYLHSVTARVVGAYVSKDNIYRHIEIIDNKDVETVFIGGLESFTILADPIPNGTLNGNSPPVSLPHLLVPSL
jgi:hypothetical protein